jgi:glycosyltransferase involved in cell wall biosynthesis
VHGTNFVAPPARAPAVVSVHDLSFVKFPGLCQEATLAYEPAIRAALARGASVHADSDFVADEVREHYSLPPERVVRVYPGITPMTAGAAARGHTLAGSACYVLFVGTVEPRKNLPALVRAFDIVAPAHPDVHLVVAGAAGWGLAEFEAAVSIATAHERVHWLRYVDDRDRADLLAGAVALAYPSLYEGFGLPPLEAMSAGTPVVTTTAGAIPEAVDGAALLVDPADDDALAHALDQILGDASLRDQLVAAGRSRVETFSWTDATEQFVAMYRRLAERA